MGMKLGGIFHGSKKQEKCAVAPIALEIGNLHNIGSRENQQDSFGISDVSNREICEKKGILAVVADGMGGLAGGAEISALVTSHMLERFPQLPPAQNPADELAQLTAGASKRVCGYLSESREEGGSTMVAAIVRDGFLHFASVGDSRICLIRGGAMIQLNRAHTYGAELDEQAARGEITLEQARSDAQRHALTSYLGLGEAAKIDFSQQPVRLMKGDRVLLMSDGVFGTLTDDEILSACAISAVEAAVRIEREILKKEKAGQDNFTAILIACV